MLIITNAYQPQPRWMKYWICFGAFSSIEILTDLFLSFWLPLYYEAKIFFLLWLVSPYSNGAHILYTTVIKPQLDKRETVSILKFQLQL